MKKTICCVGSSGFIGRQIYSELKKINNYDELSGNLALDFEKSKKKIYENKNLINRLGQKTLNDTMKIVNSFLDGKII